MNQHVQKPAEGEYDSYVYGYIKLLSDDGDLLTYLAEGLERVKQMVMPLDEDFASTPHEAGEWTIKEILLHIIDDERIFAYRTLRIARDDKTNLPGFEQDDYIAPSRANERTIADLMEEYESVRMATITLFKYLPDEAFTRIGQANNHPVSVRALGYHIAGHELHHLYSIQENYLSNS